MIKTVMFDLDGTLLPMDLKEFINKYFGLLHNKVDKAGYDANLFTDSLFKATEKVTKNEGEITNETLFWQVFEELSGYEKNYLIDML